MEMWWWIGIAAILVGAVGVLLWRTVRLDGLGHRPPPASQRHWVERAGQPT